MNIDVVIGSPGDEKGPAGRHNLGPDTILAVSPLAVVEEIRRKVKPPDKIGLLRIFLVRNESQFPTSQLARLGGLFGVGGGIEIFVAKPSGPGGPPPTLNAGASGFGGSGGMSGFSGQASIGGFQFSGNLGGSSRGENLSHLSNILSVPVRLSQL